VRNQPEILEDSVPRGMQESGRFEELRVQTPVQPPLSTSALPQSREALAEDTLRQKARNRRKIQIVSGRTTPVASNTSVNRGTAESFAPTSYPTNMAQSQSKAPPAPIDTNPEVPPRSSPTKSSPRLRMRDRHRRRLDTQRSSPTSNSSPRNAGVAAN
jgi:hypothetical protein